MEEDIVIKIYADRIDEPPNAMRKDINREALMELADDIKKNGLINPITVRPVGDRFEVVAGHRRFLACGIARIVQVPCVVRKLDDAAAFAIMASENLKRSDVDPVDEAEFVLKILQNREQSFDELAATVGRSVKWVEDRLTVAQMPDYMKGFLKSGQLKLGAALALVQIEEEPKRQIWTEMGVRDGISVRVAEYYLYQHRRDQLPGAVASDLPSGDAPAAAYKAPMFKCSVDGKEYPAAECQAVFVWRGNMSCLDALRLELNAPPTESDLSSS